MPKEACTCPECGATELRRVGKGKPSTVYDYVQPFLRKRVYLREKDLEGSSYIWSFDARADRLSL